MLLLINSIDLLNGQDEIYSLKEALLHAAHPMCVESSETLRKVQRHADISDESSYFDRHSSLRSLLRWLNSEKTDKPIKVVVATHSPARHLNGGDELDLGSEETFLVKLHEFSKSEELRIRLWDDFFEPLQEKKLLLVQCELSQSNCTRAAVAIHT